MSKRSSGSKAPEGVPQEVWDAFERRLDDYCNELRDAAVKAFKELAAEKKAKKNKTGKLNVKVR